MRLADQGIELRYGTEQIRDETIVSNLEDRCIGIFVDRDDHLAVLHTGKVLDRTADTNSNVQIRRDDLYLSAQPACRWAQSPRQLRLWTRQ